MRRRSTIPVPLLVGLVVGFYGSAAALFASFTVRASSREEFAAAVRWLSFNSAAQIAEMMLVAVALFGVARRAAGTPRTLVLVAAWAQVATLVWFLSQSFVLTLVGESSALTVDKYIWWTLGTGWIAAMVCLAIASRAFHQPSWVTVFAVLGVLTTLISPSTPVIGEYLGEALGHGVIVRAYMLVTSAVQAASLLVLVHGISCHQPPATPEPHFASRAFRRAALALLLRIAAAIALALFAAGLVREADMLKILLVAAPAIMLVATLAFVWSVLDVERSALEGMPRVRLAIGAALIAWTAGVQGQQAAAIYGRTFDTSSFFIAEQWSIIAPLTAIVGIAFVISAINAFARARSDLRLQGIVVSRGTWFVVLSLAGTFLPLAVREPETGMMFILLAVGCSISAIGALADLMTRTSKALTDAPALPAARVRQ